MRDSCVPIRQNENDEKEYFFRAGHHLGSFRHHLESEKCYFCRRRVCFFTCLLKHYDNGCLVVTELLEKCSIFPMYTVSVQ